MFPGIESADQATQAMRHLRYPVATPRSPLAAAEDACALAAGDLAPDAETARSYADRGLRFIGIGSDATLLALAGRRAVDCVRAGGS